jgi:uncharacterized membrane protein
MVDWIDFNGDWRDWQFRCLYFPLVALGIDVDGFAPASIVAPLGTVAILCNALIAPLVFHETFRVRDFMGVVLSTAGAVTIVLSAKTQEEKVCL